MSLAAEVVPCGNEGTGEAVHGLWPLSQILRFGAKNWSLLGFSWKRWVEVQAEQRIRAGCFVHVRSEVCCVARALASACRPGAYVFAEAEAMRSARKLFTGMRSDVLIVSLLYDVRRFDAVAVACVGYVGVGLASTWCAARDVIRLLVGVVLFFVGTWHLARELNDVRCWFGQVNDMGRGKSIARM